MFFTPEELCDVVSILPYCSEDDRFLLLNDERIPGYWIPSKKSFMNKQWKSLAQELLDEFFLDGTVNNVCKLVRLWKPPGKGHIHHVVFTALIRKDNKKKDSGSHKLKLFWATCEEIQQSYSRLRSPELLDFMSCVKNKCLQRPAQFASSINPEGSWTKLIEDNPQNLIVEVLERHIFPDIKISSHQRLLDSAGFSRRVQIGLYVHFLMRCFPCTYMNTAAFTKILKELGWDEKASIRLFHTADIHATGFLSYRDFLYFMAVMEPKTQSKETGGELRSRYIFRHYDRNNDKVLDREELKHLVDDVLRVKKKTALKSASDVCSVMYAGGSDFTTNMKSFLDLISNLKLRGTSMLLRSTTSITDTFPPLSEDIKFVKFIPESSPVTGVLATRVVTFFPGSSESVTSLTSGSRSELWKTYDVDIHYVKLTEDGTAVDIDKLQVSSHCGPSTPINDSVYGKTFKKIYSSSQVEVLRSIKFFTREMSAREAAEKSLKGPKPAFSWGSVDPSTIVPSLLKVCEGVTLLLNDEPRLVEMNPPVCALGELHGSFSDLLLFEKAFWNLGPTLSPTSLLFLGDYVDRGPHGVEVIAYLFALKLEAPHKMALLRGSQEIRVLHQTFFTECTERFGETLGTEVWHAMNAAMDCLPLAAVVGGKVFCCHGGIPPPWLCPVVSTINSIPSPLPKPDEESPLAWELMWNEPLKRSDVTEGLEAELEAKEGFAMNPSKGTGHLFNGRALKKFLGVNGLSLLLRAHEMQEEEYSEDLRHVMLTLYSATGNKSRKEDSTCVLVYLGKDRQKEVE